MRKLILLLIITIFVAGCTKKDDPAPVSSLDVTYANVAGTYKITAATATQSGVSVDVFNNPSYYPTCQKDDIITLNVNATYSVADVGVICSPPNNYSGPYTVNTAAKTITLVSGTGNVVSLTTSALVIAQDNYQGSGATLTVTYTRQ